jgi:hypothetical protein
MLEMLEASQVENADVAIWSWVQLAAVLGMSKQAVHRMHPRRLKAKVSGKTRRGDG